MKEMERMWVTKKSGPSHTVGSTLARSTQRQRKGFSSLHQCCHCLVKWAISVRASSRLGDAWSPGENAFKDMER